MHLVAGVREVDVVPNGVDVDWFRPQEVPQQPRSCVFWGRLDFGPNVQALTWFVRQSGPSCDGASRMPASPSTASSRHQKSKCWLMPTGFPLSRTCRTFAPRSSRHSVVVLPFVSGGGIKNKLLEAASMGLPIVCTPRACGGLQTSADLPLTCCSGGQGMGAGC